jgi:hypothetical protein
MGIAGTVGNMESMARVSAMMTLGIQYDRFNFTLDPEFNYVWSKSMRSRTILHPIKTSGSALEFGLPFKCSYSFLDLAQYRYTPYITAGFGYNFRQFSYTGSFLIASLHDAYGINSLTLNYGLGFLVKISEQTRFQVAVNGISYFNESKGAFNYDTTGASLAVGVLLVFY